MYRLWRKTLVSLVLAVTVSTPAIAHLMEPLHGTLNLVDDDAFMVLSLPVTAIDGLDADGDARVSMVEFNRYRTALVEVVVREVTLSDRDGPLPLEGILLSPSQPHGGEESSVMHVVVMGRYVLTGANGRLSFRVGLFGADQRPLKITASRPADGLRHKFVLTSAEPGRDLKMPR